LAVKIRLRRMGAKKRPFYRFVATDSRMPRDGRFIEILGHYNPIDRPATVELKEEKVYHWLKQGAIPSDTVSGLFKQIGLWKKWEMIKKGEDASQVTLTTQLAEKRRKKKKKGKAEEAAAPAAEGVAAKKETPAEEPKKEERAEEIKDEKKEEKKEEKKAEKEEGPEEKKEVEKEKKEEKKEEKKDESEEHQEKPEE
jgi:small subunit ribosomal protein S16